MLHDRRTILLLGRTPAVIADLLERVDAPAVTFFTGSSLEDVVAVLERTRVDHVILGGGLELDTRLQIVRTVFESSTSTTVHMNSPSVVLAGFAGRPGRVKMVEDRGVAC